MYIEVHISYAQGIIKTQYVWSVYVVYPLAQQFSLDFQWCKFKFTKNELHHRWFYGKFATYVVRWAIWYHLYNLKNVKSTHGGVLNIHIKHPWYSFFAKVNCLLFFPKKLHHRCLIGYKIRICIFLLQKQPPEEFCKKDVLKNFAKFTEKHLCQSLFINKVAGLSLRSTLLKKKIWLRCFPVNFAKFLRTPFL